MGNLQKDNDRYTGEIFESLDARDDHRRVRIDGYKDGVFGRKYSYETIVNDGAPDTVGRRGHLSPKTLDKHWKKVSH